MTTTVPLATTMKDAVDQIAHLILQRGLSRAQEMIGTAGVLTLPSNGHTTTPKPIKPPSPDQVPLVKPPKERFSKRVDMKALKTTILEYVSAHPNQRLEEMTDLRPRGVKLTSIKRALHALVEDGALTVTGVARGTRYFLATKKAVAAKKSAPTKKSPKK